MYNTKKKYSALILFGLGMAVSSYGLYSRQICCHLKPENFYCEQHHYEHIVLEKTNRGRYQLVFIQQSGDNFYLDENLWQKAGDVHTILQKLEGPITIWTRTAHDRRILGLESAQLSLDPQRGIDEMKRNNLYIFIFGLLLMVFGAFYFYHIVYK